MSQAGGRSAGFTLLEVVIGVVVSGLLLAGMAAGLRIGIGTWRSAEASERQMERLSAARQAVLRAFGSIRPDFASPDRLDHRVDFDGDAQGARFGATLPEALAHDVVGRQALLFVRGDGAGGALVLRWSFGLPAHGAPPADAVLLDRVMSARLRYWGRFDQDEAEGWHDAWGGQSRPPRLVHLEVSRADGDTLVVDARVAAEAAPFCDYNPVTLGCDRP